MATSSGERSRSIVKDLVSTIENNFGGFNISEIIKGGSQGHGTGVDTSDIDLVVYSRDISGPEVLAQGEDQFKKWLIMLDKFLSDAYNPMVYKRRKLQPRSIKFEFKGQIQVDLLVSPYFETPKAFYDFLRTIPERTRNQFTVCASKWQVGFFKQQPPQVKEYIRKAKLWRDEEWSNSDLHKPSSYLVSLLVVAAYKKSKRKVGEGLMELALKVTTNTLDLTWSHYYKLKEVEDLLPHRPRIVDPANPANNVLESGLRTNWSTRKSTISRYMLSVAAMKTRTRYMHLPPGLTQSEASQVLELSYRCYTWSKTQWRDDDVDEEDNGRPSRYFLYILILKAFLGIQNEKNRRGIKKLKKYVHLVQRKLITVVDQYSTGLDLPDPVDPANNLYLTEIEKQKNKTLTKWSVLKERIKYVDLSQTPQQILVLYS